MRERERERERQTDRERETEREKAHVARFCVQRTFLHQIIDAVQSKDRRSVTLPDRCFPEGSQAWRVCPHESGSSPRVSSDRDHGPAAGRRRHSKSRTV
jgi:hypothetical protein